jgi:hypothetical protein
MAENPFTVELAFFESHLAEFLEKAKGKFVLIKGEEVVGFFDTDNAAYKAGIERFGVAPFLIREVLPEEQMYDIPAYRLGLIHARL